MTDLTQRMVRQLTHEEGSRQFAYYDSKGIMSIGVGRNLQSVGLRPDEIALMLANDIEASVKFLSQYAWFTAQSEVRQAALIDMSFMGIEKLLHFVNMIHYLTVDDYVNAGKEVRNSQWFIDVKEERGNRVATMVETGAWPADILYA